MKTIKQFRGALFLCCLGLAACGGSDSSAPAPTYTVGGSVTGLLSSATVVLQNNGANTTSVAVNASFSFSTMLAQGSSYSVTVLTQPVGQTCTVTNGSGSVPAADVSVAVACTANSFTIGGTVTGLLSGNSLGLQTTGANATVAANGSFTMTPALVTRTAYAVTVVTQPTGQTCTVTNGSGTLAGANVTNLAVSCTTSNYTVSANVFGLLPSTSITLQDNGGDNLVVSSSGTFAFAKSVASHGAYAVTILTEPTGQSCTVTTGTGTVAAANVTVSILCPWEIAYVSNYYSGAISAYYIDPSSGSLLPFSGNPISLGGNGNGLYGGAIALSPNGKFAYEGNDQSPNGVVSSFAIDQLTGALTVATGTPITAGGNPQSASFTPNGEFLYVGYVGYEGDPLLSSPHGIAAFTVDATTGALAAIAESAFATVNPVPLVVDPTGQFLYTSGANYTINALTGALTAIAGSTGIGGDGQGTLAVTSTANFNDLVVYDGSSLSVSIINETTGALTPVGGSPFALSCMEFCSLAVTPNGQFVYVVAEGVVSAFNVDPTTGALSPLTGGTYAANPEDSTAVTVDPSGKFLYVSDWSSGAIVALSINPTTGALTPVTGNPFQGAGFTTFGGFSIAIHAF